MKKLLLIALFLIIFSAMPAFAVKITNLFHADLPVSSQSPEERAQAVRVAFSQLLIKLTGNPDIAKNPDIMEAIQRADYFVQEFSYSLPSTSSATYFVHITFEANDVKRLLRREGIHFWGEKRPLILVWLAMTNPKHPTEVISNGNPGDVMDIIKQQSKKFALPLIFPLMDVTDMSIVSPEEVATMSLPVLKQAGKRYSPNAYLIGNIEAYGDGYESEWQLILNKDQWKWSITDKTIDGVIAAVLYQASQTLSRHYDARL